MKNNSLREQNFTGSSFPRVAIFRGQFPQWAVFSGAIFLGGQFSWGTVIFIFGSSCPFRCHSVRREYSTCHQGYMKITNPETILIESCLRKIVPRKNSRQGNLPFVKLPHTKTAHLEECPPRKIALQYILLSASQMKFPFPYLYT